MLKRPLKIDLWSLWLTATAPSAAQDSSDAQAYSGKRASRRGGVESEGRMSEWADGSSSMSSGVVLTTARAASGL